MSTEIRELLADLCHSQWSGWMKYLFSKCSNNGGGALIIPAQFVTRWKRQLSIPYSELSKEEQDSDRKEADKFIELIMSVDTYRMKVAFLESCIRSGEIPDYLR